MKPELARGRFTSQETGTIKLVPNADGHPVLCRVESIPWRSAYRYRDICALRGEEDGVWLLGDILIREYDHRAVILYGTGEQRDRLLAVYMVLGCPTEAKPGPDPDGVGLLYVAFNAPMDPVAVALSCGVMQPPNLPMPTLEEIAAALDDEG